MLLACGSDDSPAGGGGTAGSSSNAGSSNGGSSSTAGSSSMAGSQSSAGQAGSSSAAGSGGAAGGSGGTSSVAGSGGAAGGSGGSTSGGASGSGGAAGGSGGATSMPTAVANITGVNGKTVTGTATFTQGATETTLVLNLTACPAGVHASHLHEKPDCGQEGNAAAGHWMPNGIDLGDYTCADNKVTFTKSKPIAMWTVGDGSATDITKHAFMVHEMGDAGGNPGGRIGCGVPQKK
jgi:Cu/Zn superoxide dismutase